MEFVTFSNGVKMPILGFGTYALKPEETEKLVSQALKDGYRCIDTAAGYFNEEQVGAAIKKSGIPRDQLFIVTKLWIQDQGYENAKKAFEASLKKLQLDYVDLYLIHQPFGDYYGSWRAIEELYESGKARAIGVSNFDSERLVDLIWHNRIVPHVNQVEINPYTQRESMVNIMREYKVQPMGWGPFTQGHLDIFHDPVLTEIANHHNKTTAQVILRWFVEKGIQTIPRTCKLERISENFNIFDFKLTKEEIDQINKLERNAGLFPPKFDTPEHIAQNESWIKMKIHE